MTTNILPTDPRAASPVTCLRELGAEDFYRHGNHYLVVSRDNELIRLNHLARITDRRRLAPAERFQFKLLHHLGPTMAGIKPMTVMRLFPRDLPECATCRQAWNGVKNEFATLAALDYRVLPEPDPPRPGQTVIFFHREACTRLLAVQAVRLFMTERGFPAASCRPDPFIAACLERWSSDGTLPAELGLLMGIPLKDVRGYLHRDRHRHLLTRGWNIYDSLHPSLLLQRTYKRLRHYAAMGFLRHPFQRITRRLAGSGMIGRLDLLYAAPRS
jgi:hypothetical protein